MNQNNGIIIHTHDRIGKTFAVAPILIALVIFSLSIYYEPRSLTIWCTAIVVLNTGISLYYGKKWAKYILAIYLFGFGLISLKTAFPPYENISSWPLFFLVLVVIILCFIFSPVLIFSRRLNVFLNYQSQTCSDSIKKYLRYSWIVILVTLGIIFIRDIYRIFIVNT